MGVLYESEHEGLLREQAKERGITPEELLREIADWVVAKPLRAAARAQTRAAKQEAITRQLADPNSRLSQRKLREEEEERERREARIARLTDTEEEAAARLAARSAGGPRRLTLREESWKRSRGRRAKSQASE